ncbi:MAG: tetratricopeptide repeat protein, partial [Terriglobales bacterium]
MPDVIVPMQRKTQLFLISVLASIPLVAGAQTEAPDACPRDPSEFAQIQRRAADKDPSAQTALAFCYDLGLHVQPSRRENIHWLTEAAEQGYGPAQYELGRIYLYGRGVPADYPLALRWERKAAEQGDARAQRDLAFMYERGLGVAADPAQAAAWNRKAAGQGQVEAQVHLAKALEDGAGVPKDPAEANQWYAKAARQEQPAAQFRLAQIYSQDADCGPALRLYQEAASGGETQAMHELGKLYLARKCGADRAQAYLWFTIGSRFGLMESRVKAEELSHSLSAAQKRT